MSELMLMRITYVYMFEVKDEIKREIESYVEKINPQKDYNLTFNRDQLSFYFRDYKLMIKYTKHIVYLLNKHVHLITEDDVYKEDEEKYTVHAWS